MRDFSVVGTSILVAASLLASSCGSGNKKTSGTVPSQAQAPTIAHTHPDAAKSKTPAPAPATTKQQEPADPVEALIARAEAEYSRGQANYNAGHMESAKESFDNAFNVLLSGPVNVQQDDRLQREFDKIVEATHELEMQALRAGDGFTEQLAEPAPIDEANDVTFPVDPAIKAKAQAELANTRSDLPLVMNDYVASFINYFSSTKGRSTLEHALVRSGRYREMISRVLKEEGVPQDLIYLAQAESGFHPLALSKAGARGMWQFMAGRAVGYGLERNWWVDDRQDPEKSTRAAAKHLRDLYNQFGDWYLAMAAYNSGPGTVQRAVQRTGYADFWELYKRNVLPQETRNYVPIIVAVTIMAKNPSQYGLDRLTPETAFQSDKVRINYPVDLRLVAECVDSSVATLQELNPSLLRMTTPKDMAFDLHLPAGTADKFQRTIAAIPQEMRVYWRYHKVESGETLTTIARRYHTTATAIAEANNLDESDLRKDSKLIIPVSPSKAAAAATSSSSESASVSYSKHPVRYTVRKGDTVLSVADDYGVPVDRIRRWNHLKGTQLRPGKVLLIYKPAADSKESEVAEKDTPKRSSSKASESKAASAKGATSKKHSKNSEQVTEKRGKQVHPSSAKPKAQAEKQGSKHGAKPSSKEEVRKDKPTAKHRRTA